MVVFILPLLRSHDNLTLKLHQKKSSNLGEGLLFTGRFNVGSVPGMAVVFVVSKNESIEIHWYDTRPLIKSYNSH